MKYHIKSSAIIDVTKPPYCVDNTGKVDCTETIRKILDDILIRQVEALQATYDKLIELSYNKKEDVTLGIETAKVQNGRLAITFPEYEPSNKIIFFPKGTYLVSDTLTYTLENLKQFWYWVPNFENNKNIHFLGESKEETIILLADNARGFEEGKEKALISFVNNELKLPRNEEFTNVAFMNTIEDITLDCGKGNPGAVGIKYASSNCGRIQNVDIKTKEGMCGIYVANNTSQAVFSDITISGFDYGIDAECSAMLVIDQIDVSNNKRAGIYTGSSTMNCNNINSGQLPTVKFKKAETKVKGRYYFTSPEITFANDNPGNHIYFETEVFKEKSNGIPKNIRSDNPDDWAYVDDYGAVGDGKTDSTRAIQKAMNSGKSIVVFGEGEYLIDGKIKIPKSVRTVDFLFCSLACGTRLVGGEYDSAFEISEASDELLFIENLSAWERFKGHIRLVKHAAKRDTVFSDIHLMTASMYFNSVSGSRVYFDNCFLTTGTYIRNGSFQGTGFVPAYCHIIPFEFHGQKVYGRVVNPERAEVAMLNDASEVLIDGFRIEGSGTALKSINGGMTKFNLFNAGLGIKEAENPVFELYDSSLELAGCVTFGFNTNTEYNIIISNTKNGKTEILQWDDIENQEKPHWKILDQYKSYF